jgi:CDP-diacylglycerol--serine O-phosphatidyltransferase
MTTIIPSLLTIINLSCGVVALLLNHPIYSQILIFVAMIFDYFDGKAARLLKAESEFGKQLDSLSDMVTFGIAPAFFYFKIINNNNILTYFAISLIPICSAIRLAKFNISNNQKKYFIGLPTPANAFFFSSLVLINSIYEKSIYNYIFNNYFALISLPVIFSILMVLPLKMLSAKYLPKGRFNYFIMLIFIIVLLISLIIFKLQILPVIIIVYILISIILNLLKTIE